MKTPPSLFNAYALSLGMLGAHGELPHRRHQASA
ncbi:hypothetical protein LMG6001_00829 [Achromobacter insolitus]|nr:hypothetical protein LMG6003_01258 [Achromobacter insolitus]CAB3944154.1 hypothetical protein LMG6001_00829 [Achromobacter insolitus]VEG72760.1 Uncharacterised protein [Achromobacter insolitus]